MSQGKTKYRILYEKLLAFFLSSYAPGDLLPTEHELLDRFHAGRGTLRTALNRLNDQGIIERIPGRGTYLSEQYQIGLKRYRIAVILSELEFADTSVWEYTWFNNMEMINGVFKESLHQNLEVELIPESTVCSAPEAPFDGYLAFRYIKTEILEMLEGPVEQIRYNLDIVDGLRKIVEHSIAAGIQRPAYIGNTTQGRIETVQEVLSAHGFPPIPHHKIVSSSGTITHGFDAAKILLKRAERPDCIYCSTDLRAVGVLQFLKEQQIRVPEDVRVYGFDGTRVSRTVSPALTTCAFDWQFFGRNAVHRIRARLDSIKRPTLDCLKGELQIGGSAPSRSIEEWADRCGQIRHIASLPSDISVEDMADQLRGTAARFSYDTAMESLYQWSLQAGYITREQLEHNELMSFYDSTYDLSFPIQISHSRTSYQPKGRQQEELPRDAGCLICSSMAGAPGRELLRLLPIELTRPFFLQLTPYPLFPRHFVLIDRDHRPMQLDEQALRDAICFLERAPEYTLCSNSDKAWAGASILEHMHFQTARLLQLPIFSALPIRGNTVYHNGLTVHHLDYPIASLRLLSADPEEIIAGGGKIISAWKNRWKHNTVNLAARINEGWYELYIIFRNPAWRNPRHLQKYKSEGVGVVEVCGYWLFPPPEHEETYREIKDRGRTILREFFAGLNPLQQDETAVVSEVIAAVYQEEKR